MALVNYTTLSGSIGHRVDASGSTLKPNETLVLFILRGVVQPRVTVKQDIFVSEDSKMNTIKVRMSDCLVDFFIPFKNLSFAPATRDSLWQLFAFKFF